MPSRMARKPEVFSLYRSASYSSTTVYVSIDYETSSVAVLSFVESRSDVVEKHQSMIARGSMHIFPGLPYDVYVANLSARPILFTRNLDAMYASIAADYAVGPQGEESDFK